MALIGYFKAEPTEYILAYSNGRIFRQGAGQSFWYLPHRTSIVLVPVSTTDVSFVFNEATSNFQVITLQGQFTYRISEPQTIAQVLDFTITPRTHEYRSEDPEKLKQRIINIVQMYTRHELQGLELEEALRSSERMARGVMEHLRQEQPLAFMGVECLSIFFTSIKATPEMSRALEAEYREALQKRADQAIYSRRAEAVEQERKIAGPFLPGTEPHLVHRVRTVRRAVSAGIGGCEAAVATQVQDPVSRSRTAAYLPVW